MSTRQVYADASILISLARIDRLDILTLLPNPVLVTRQVWQEIAGDPRWPGAAALQSSRQSRLLFVVEEGDPDAFPELDAGESTVFSAAIAAAASVFVDERRARAWIARNPDLRAQLFQVTGLVGLLLAAKRRGYIQHVRPVLDALRLEDFRISRRLYENTLRDAGEL